MSRKFLAQVDFSNIALLNTVVDSTAPSSIVVGSLYTVSATVNSITSYRLRLGTSAGTSKVIPNNDDQFYIGNTAVSLSQGSGGVTAISGLTSVTSANSSSTAITFGSGTQTGAASGNVTLISGATTTSGASGNVTIDVGAGASGQGTLAIGNTNATAINVGKSGGGTLTTIYGNVQIPSLTSGTTQAILRIDNSTGALYKDATSTFLTSYPYVGANQTTSAAADFILDRITSITGRTGTNTLAIASANTTSANSGAVSLQSGTTTTSGTSGLVTLASGTSAVNSGNVQVLSGTAGNTSGNITVQSGSGVASGSITIDAGAGTSADGTVSIGTTNASAVNIGYLGMTTTIGGDLVVNGTTTSLNSSTIQVDDKNIELGSVASITGLAATLVSGVSTVTLTTGTTTGLIVGETVTKTSGTGAFISTSATIVSIDSATQFTVNAPHATSGAIVFSAGGPSNTTANGAGLTVLNGGTAPTWTYNYDATNPNWSSNVAVNATTSYMLNGTKIIASGTGLPVANGGTGSTTASGARTNLSDTGFALPQKYVASLASLTGLTIGNVYSWSIPQSTHGLPVSGDYIIQVHQANTSTAHTQVDTDISIDSTTGNITIGFVAQATSYAAGYYRAIIIG